jgi:hypothetical protein
MNRTEFEELLTAAQQRVLAINQTKGHDYAGDEDALANFKKDNERLQRIAANDPTYAKWYVYFDKHLSAIFTFLEEGDVKSEPIEGRIDDAVLYLELLRGLIVERRAAVKPRRKRRSKAQIEADRAAASAASD